MKDFHIWIDRFIEEKGIDPQQIIETEGPSGMNYIPVGSLIEAMKAAPLREQDAIQDTIIKIDFTNGDVLHYFKHLSQAIAI